MKLRKKRIVSILTVLLLAVGIVIFLMRETGDERDWHYFDSETSIEGVLFAQVSSENSDDIVYILHEVDGLRSSNSYLLGHYIVQLSRAGRNFDEMKDGRHYYWWEDDRFIFRVYDLLTRELFREFDLLQILEHEEVLENYIFGLGNVFYAIEIDGEIYLVEMLYERLEDGSFNIGEGASSRKNLLMHIYTGEHRIVEDRNPRAIHSREFEIQNSFFSNRWIAQHSPMYEDYDSFLEKNGILRGEGIGSFWFESHILPTSDTVRVTLTANNLPMENERLYTLFPDLRQFRDHEDDSISINIILTGNHWTAEDILSLFMEDGQEITFEGVIMHGDFSIDGEEHEIHSFEDYFRLRDFSEWGEVRTEE